MTLLTKFISPAVGPSSFSSDSRTGYEGTDIAATGLFQVGNRLSVSGRNYTLKWEMATSDGTNGAVDVVSKLYADTLGGALLFGMVPPPCPSDYAPRVLGNKTKGEFSGVFTGSRVDSLWVVEEVGTGGSTPGATGLTLSTGTGDRDTNYAGLVLAPSIQPNIVYRLDYTIVGTATMDLGISGSWFGSLPYSGPMGDFTFTAPTTTADGKMTLDLTEGDHSFYFSIPEDPVASTSANPAFSAKRFAIRTVGSAYTGSKTAEIERIGLFRVGSLFRFESLTVTKETAAKYTLVANLAESTSSALNSPISHRV